MKKTNKENPLTFFRKANEARQKVVKNSLTKARNGMVVIDVADAIRKRNYYTNEDGTLNTNNRSNVDTVNQSILDKNKSTSSTPNNPWQEYLDQKTIIDQDRQRDGTPKRPSMSKAMMDALINRPKSNTPIMDSIIKQKKGGSVKSKKK
jgi:hypothetical protein